MTLKDSPSSLDTHKGTSFLKEFLPYSPKTMHPLVIAIELWRTHLHCLSLDNSFKALFLIEKLKIKSEFLKLAKSYSIGPSKKNGGNLGWFRSGQMVKEFEEAVLKLEKGKITKKPVKTKFGYHIIMLNDIRDAQPKKINDIKQQIVERIKQNSLSHLEKQLRKNKSIKISDFKKVVQEINN